MANKKVGIPKTTVGTNSGATVELWVLDRLSMPRLFPETGSLDDQIHAKNIARKVVLEQDEATDCALVSRNGRLSYNQLKDFKREIHFTTGEVNFLQSQVQRMDDEKLITFDMIGVCTTVKEIALEGKGKRIVTTNK
jgi:hypothetical protein